MTKTKVLIPTDKPKRRIAKFGERARKLDQFDFRTRPRPRRRPTALGESRKEPGARVKVTASESDPTAAAFVRVSFPSAALADRLQSLVVPFQRGASERDARRLITFRTYKCSDYL
ncbi:unnamed protein product, partial [Iphiclides podalirius]